MEISIKQYLVGRPSLINIGLKVAVLVSISNYPAFFSNVAAFDDFYSMWSGHVCIPDVK